MTVRPSISRAATAFVVLGSCAIAAPVAAAAPSVTLDTPPDGSVTNDATPLYNGQAGDAPGDAPEVTVRIYSGPGAGGNSVQTLTATRAGTAWSVEGSDALPDGVYTAVAEQADVLSDVGSSAPATFTVATSPPDTALSSAPSGSTNDPTPEFRFDSAGAAGFVCRLYADGGSAAAAAFACASPYTPEPLGDGAYVFEVAAVDAAGNRDASPASRGFTVDTVAPESTITVGPGDSTAATATFVFSADGAAGFECRVDGGGWEPCESPASYAGVTAGGHTFEVRASDAAGNVETTPAAWSWRVLAPSEPPPASGEPPPDSGGTPPDSGGTPPDSGGTTPATTDTTPRLVETIPAVEKQAWRSHRTSCGSGRRSATPR